MEKMCVLDKLLLDMSYSAVSSEFSVNESTLYNKQKHVKQGYDVIGG